MTWCWWCCHDFNTTELKLPYKYNHMTEKYSTCGCFCSWSCMKAYTLDKYGVTRGGQIICNIVTMRKKVYNIVDRIKIAPYKYSLKEFGGHMTIEEFRDGGTVDKGAQNAVPLTNQVQIVEEFVKRPTVVQNESKLFQISGSNGTNEPLRLKRAKPLKRDENNLEKTLGITRKKTG